MEVADVIISLATLLTTYGLCQIGVTKSWWQATRKHRSVFYILCVWVGITFVGSGSAAQISSIGIPDAVRLLRMAVLLVLAIYAFAKIINKPSCVSRSGGSTQLMLAYGILGLLSVAWSVAPIVTIWKSFEVIVFVLVAMSMAAQIKTLDNVLEYMGMLNVIILFLVTSIFWGIIIAPGRAFANLEHATGPMGFVAGGVFPAINANTCTQLAALLICICVSQYLSLPKFGKKRNTLIIVSAISLIVMVLGHSRTSIFGFALAMAVILYFNRNMVLIAVLAFCALIGMIFGLSDFIASYIYRGQSENAFTTLSGRTHFWEGAWDVYIQSPIIGHGFYSQRATLGVSTVDMTYLQILLGLGVFGLVIILIALIKCGINFLRSIPKRNSGTIEKMLWLQCSAFFILILVRSLTGPTFQDFHNNLIFLLMLFVMQATYMRHLRSSRMKSRKVETQARLKIS